MITIALNISFYVCLIAAVFTLLMNIIGYINPHSPFKIMQSIRNIFDANTFKHNNLFPKPKRIIVVVHIISLIMVLIFLVFFLWKYDPNIIYNDFR